MMTFLQISRYYLVPKLLVTLDIVPDIDKPSHLSAER